MRETNNRNNTGKNKSHHTGPAFILSLEDGAADVVGERGTLAPEEQVEVDEFWKRWRSLAQLREFLRDRVGSRPDDTLPMRMENLLFAETLLLLDKSIHAAMRRIGGRLDLGDFDRLAEAMKLAVIYPDVVAVLEQLGPTDEPLVRQRVAHDALNSVLQGSDADEFERLWAIIIAPEPPPRRSDKGWAQSVLGILRLPKGDGGLHRAAVRALALWQACSDSTIERRLNMFRVAKQ